MFVTPHKLTKPHIIKLNEHLNKYYYNFQFNESKIIYSERINRFNSPIMKFIFNREDSGDYLYILTGISIVGESEILILNKYNPNEHTLIIELFNQFPNMPNYKLIYSKYSEPAQLQWIRSDYSNQCYADAIMYTVFSVPLQSRLEFIFEELNGDLVLSNKRLMIHNIISFMLGVNNFISRDTAQESFHIFLNTLYNIDPTFTSKDQNEPDWLFLQHILGLDYFDNYHILTTYQEKVKNPEKNYLIKRLGPYTTSFELIKSHIYSMQSILTYTPGHFTSIIKTQSYGWVKYNDMSRQIELLDNIKDYKQIKATIEEDKIDICNEYHTTKKLFNEILDAHQEYWEMINDTDAVTHIERRIITVVTVTDTHETQRNLFNELKLLNDYTEKQNIINEFRNFYTSMHENAITEKLRCENQKTIEMINTFEKYHLKTDFNKVHKIFTEKVKVLKQMCPNQAILIDKFVNDHLNTTADQLMTEEAMIQDSDSIKFYPARFAIYDRIVTF